jgi:acetylornithine deacetylase
MNELTQLLQDLVAIDSVNPDLQPGAAGETRAARFVEAWFQHNGFETHWLEATPGRPSVVGIVRGTGIGGRSLMFNGHLDTVGLLPFDGAPLQPRIADGRMYGRGAYDMKCGVAAMMIAAKRCKTLGLSGDILVACVADEEYASLGSEEVVKHFRADAAIVTEPSGLQFTIAHKGFVWFDVTVHGVSAHGSRPELGVDAIAKMGKFLSALEQYDLRLRQETRHATLKHGSVHASLIKGGQEISSYPAACTVSLERRTVPGEAPEQVEAELRAILDDIAAHDTAFRYTLTAGFGRAPMEIAPTADIVQTAARAFERVNGRLPTYRAEPFWTDAEILQSASIPAFLFGADGAGAHAAVEYVDLASVETVCEVLYQTACAFCA